MECRTGGELDTLQHLKLDSDTLLHIKQPQLDTLLHINMDTLLHTSHLKLDTPGLRCTKDTGPELLVQRQSPLIAMLSITQQEMESNLKEAQMCLHAAKWVEFAS